MSGLRFILKKRWLFRELLHSSPPANRSSLYKNDVMLHCIVLLCHFSLGTDVPWCQIVKMETMVSVFPKLLKPGREDCEAGRWCQADSSELFLVLKYGTFQAASIVESCPAWSLRSVDIWIPWFAVRLDRNWWIWVWTIWRLEEFKQRDKVW